MTVAAVLGARGTIGRALVRELIESDESLRILAVSRRGGSDFTGLTRCDEIVGDVLEPGFLDQLAGRADLVVNLSARNPAGVEQDWAARRAFFRVNALGACLLAAATQRHHIPLIHFSTVSVYETAEYVHGGLLSETVEMPRIGGEISQYFDRSLEKLSQLAAMFDHHRSDAHRRSYDRYLSQCACPQNAPIYGLSKLIGERLALGLSEQTCCLRLSDVYGPGHESRGVIIDHLHQLGHEDVVQVTFGRRASISFFFIADIARLIALLMRRLLDDPSGVPRVMNVSGERVTAPVMRSHLRKLCTMRNVPSRIELAPSAQPQFDRRYSTAILDRNFATFEQTPFFEGLQLAFDRLRVRNDS